MGDKNPKKAPKKKQGNEKSTAQVTTPSSVTAKKGAK